MSIHPNVILMAVLTPDNLSRKTMRDILAEHKQGVLYRIVIAGTEYDTLVMESDYDEGWQISAKAGDLVFFDLVTYGYGETIAWDKLESQKKELEAWALETCKKHHCSYEIKITANYW
jgi:hypothetical protein